MPCTLCGESHHNRRTCQRWDLLLATRLDERNQLNTSSSNSNSLPVTAQHMYERFPTHNLNPLFTTPLRHTSINTYVTSHNNTTISIDNDGVTIGTVVTSRYDDVSPIRPDILFPEWDSDLDTSILDIHTLKPRGSNTLVECVKEPCNTTDCPICMEDLHKTDLFVTRCGHQFHGICMIQHIKLNDICPMCRGILFQSIKK